MQTNSEDQRTHKQAESTNPHSPAQDELPNEPPNPNKPGSEKKSASKCFLANPHWASVVASILLFLGVVHQNCQNSLAIKESTQQFKATIEEIRKQSRTLTRIFEEQQRARLSFKIELDRIEDQDQSDFRLVCPIEIGGTTEARSVRFKNYISPGHPRQLQYISFANINWEKREAHQLSDVSPTETGRRVVADPLTRQQIATVLSQQTSLYFIERLEYCDIYGECRYFMRCAELSKPTRDRNLLRD